MSGCDSIFELTLNVTPGYFFAESNSICNGNTYSWHSNNYTSAGTYYDSLLTTSGCDSIFELTLNVNPDYSFAESATICSGNTYLWHSNNYTTAGLYYDSLLTTAGCDSIFELTLNVNPVFTINNPQTICNGSSYVFNGHTYTLAGNYNDTLFSMGGCDSIISTTLIVNPLPTAVISGNDSICAGQSVNIIMALSGVSPWDVIYTDGVNNYSQNNIILSPDTISIIPTISNTYTIVSVKDSNNCYSNSSTGNAVFVVNEIPVINAGIDTEICGLTYQLNATLSVGQGTWTGPVGATFNPDNYTPNTNVTMLGYDSYNFVFMGVNGICSDVDSVQIQFYEPPLGVFAGDDQYLSYIFNTQLNAIIPNIGTGQWAVVSGTGVLSDNNDPVSLIEGLSVGQNILQWTVTNGVCVPDTDEVLIYVNDIIIPTGFSPNGDSKNDFFIIDGISNIGDLEIFVFDKWENQVYYSKKYLNKWDGKDNSGKDLPDDYYFYIIKSNNEILHSGYVLIKR